VSDAERPHLEPDRLSLWQVIALGLAYLQVGSDMAISAGGIIAFSGRVAWLSNVLSAAVMTLLAVVISAYARRFVATGSLVSYAHAAFGVRTRRLVAACLMLGYVALAATLVLGVVLFGSSALLDFGFAGAAGLPVQAALTVLVSLLAAVCAWRGIDVSVRVIAIVGFLCVPFVMLTIGLALVKLHPDVLAQFTLTDVSIKAVVQGAVAATGFYVGFDGLAALAAETHDAKRNMPRALLGTVVIAGLADTLSCFVQYPMLAAHTAELAGSASPVAILAHSAGAPWLAIVVDVLLVPATFAGVVALFNLGSRIIATTAADGLLPIGLSRLHPRFHSPHRAAVLLAVLGALVPIALQFILKTPPMLSSVYLSNLATYYWLPPYLVACAGIVRVMRREGAIALPTLGAACLAGVALIYVGVELFRSPIDAGTTYLPYFAVATIVLAGIAIVLGNGGSELPGGEAEQML
jgi:amino acid transporter